MKNIIWLILAIYLSGCAFPATKEGMVVTDYIVPKQTGEKIYVRESTGGSITLPFWKSNIPNDNFTEAVKESLLNSKAFSAQSIHWGDDWGLEIEILNVEYPYIALDVTVTTNIKYSLFLRGKKVQEITIREPGTATTGDTLIGIQRMRIANEYSAKANVKKFIAELSLKQSKAKDN